MSDIPEEVEAMMKKGPIRICNDIWFDIFPFLPPRQVGLRVALVSDRFDGVVDGHFNMRKWTFGRLRIRYNIGKNGTKEMEITKWINSSFWKALPIPDKDIPLPDKVVGCKRIIINYIDHNAMAFLHQIRCLFDSRGTNLNISFQNVDERAVFLDNIWPLIKGNICAIRHKDPFSPTILTDCPSLKLISSVDLPSFPADDSANASIGQAVANWLCTPRADGIPKMLKCRFYLPNGMQAIKRAFVTSSSPVKFVIVLRGLSCIPIVPFYLINGVTGERLTLKRSDKQSDDRKWLLVRGPISRDEKQWAEWEKEAIGWKWRNQWNKLFIRFDAFHYGLLANTDCKPGPSGQQQQQM